MLKTKRIYESKDAGDGLRLLVDRLWPRGLSKDRASIDEWSKDLAPSDALRRGFAHNKENWAEFKRMYFEELESPEKADKLEQIAREARQGNVTLLYAARDIEYNNAIVLQEFIQKMR